MTCCSMHSLADLGRVRGHLRALVGRGVEVDWKSAGCHGSDGGGGGCAAVMELERDSGF
jgi:hypothetical protein